MIGVFQPILFHNVNEGDLAFEQVVVVHSTVDSHKFNYLVFGSV